MSDLRGRLLVSAPNGTNDFGLIGVDVAASMGRPAGPIRMHYGYPGDNGYGLLHVEGYESRIKQIQNAGFTDFRCFAASICQNYVIVGEGNSGRFLLIEQRAGYDNYVVVQYDKDMYWSITTGLPTRVARCKRVVWRSARTGGSELTPSMTETRPRLATLSLPGSKAPSGGKGP